MERAPVEAAPAVTDETPAPTARLFVALWPSATARDALRALARPAAAGVRYTTPEQWHVTLRFLGTCAVREAVAALGRVRGEVCEAQAGPRVVHLGPHVVVVPVGGLEALASAVHDATADVGEPLDPRPFTGHLTIARLRTGAYCDAVGAPIDMRWPVRQLALVRSDTRPDGARYTTIATVPLHPV